MSLSSLSFLRFFSSHVSFLTSFPYFSFPYFFLFPYSFPHFVSHAHPLRFLREGAFPFRRFPAEVGTPFISRWGRAISRKGRHFSFGNRFKIPPGAGTTRGGIRRFVRAGGEARRCQVVAVDVVQGQKRIALFMPLEGDYSDVALVAACGFVGNCAPESAAFEKRAENSP